MVQKPFKNKENKFFSDGNPGPKSRSMDLEKNPKIIRLQLVPGTTIDFLLKKTQVIPGTKSGVFR